MEIKTELYSHHSLFIGPASRLLEASRLPDMHALLRQGSGTFTNYRLQGTLGWESGSDRGLVHWQQRNRGIITLSPQGEAGHYSKPLGLWSRTHKHIKAYAST